MPYLLPFLREAEEVDPLWGRETPRIDDQRSQWSHLPPAEHIAELRRWAQDHPRDRERVATYLRILRKLEPRVKQREARAADELARPPDELALEYRLPHLSDKALPDGLADPLHGYVQHGTAYYVHGDGVTKKAPHVHIAELEAWARRNPAGRPLAERYLAWFRKNADAIAAKDRELRAEREQSFTATEDVHLANSVLLQRFLRNGGVIPLAPSNNPVWDANSHDPSWVRAHLPRTSYLDRGKASNPLMRAFRRLVERSKASEEKPLAGFRIIGLQHLLSNTGSFIRALADAGVAPDDAAYMGKTYSQNAEVMEELAQDGFRIRAASFEPTAERGFANAADNRRRELDAMVRDIVREQAPRGYVERNDHPTRFVDRQHKYLVIDDGGDLIEHIHLHYPELHDRIVAVEQTRKGIRKVNQLGVRFPVINMADAMAKLSYESPMIGLALATSADMRLQRLARNGEDPGKEILLLGYGEIGERAAQALRQKGYRVSVYDIDDAARARARAHGLTVHEPPDDESGPTGLQRALAVSRVVLSTTGAMAIKPRDLEYAPDGTVFLNGASSATEFASFVEDQQMNRHPFMGGRTSMVLDPQHDLKVTTRSGKTFTMVARGQVINFDNGPGVLPPRYAQLIVGLLYMSALQAAKTTEAGVHDLALQPQHDFLADVHADLATTGETLLDPNF